MRAAAWLGLAVLLAGCAGLPRQGIGPRDPRSAVDGAAAPWRSLGLVTAAGRGRCTGAVIGPRTVLTAAHCLLEPGSAMPLDPAALGFATGAPARALAVAAFATGPGFRTLPGPAPDPEAPPDADWAVLFLDPAGPEVAAELVLPLATGLPAPGTVLAFGGYQPDRGGLVADLSCSVVGHRPLGLAGLMLRHSCAAADGASGGPLLERLPDGGWIVSGVASRAAVAEAGGWAVPGAVIWRGLAELLRRRGADAAG